VVGLAALDLQLNSMILKVFSCLNDSIIIYFSVISMSLVDDPVQTPQPVLISGNGKFSRAHRLALELQNFSTMILAERLERPVSYTRFLGR